MNPQNVSALVFLETIKHGEDAGLGLEQVVAMRQGQASDELEFTCEFAVRPIPATKSPISHFAPIRAVCPKRRKSDRVGRRHHGSLTGQ